MTATFAVTNNTRTRSEGARLADTSEATIYTAARPTKVIQFNIANRTGSAATISVDWEDTSASTDFELVYQKTINGNDSVFIETGALTLAAGDKIKATAGTGNAITIVVTVAETLGGYGAPG